MVVLISAQHKCVARRQLWVAINPWLPARFPWQAHFTDEKPEAQRVKCRVQGHTAGKRNLRDPPPSRLAPFLFFSRVCTDLWKKYLTVVLSLIGENWEVTLEEKGLMNHPFCGNETAVEEWCNWVTFIDGKRCLFYHTMFAVKTE